MKKVRNKAYESRVGAQQRWFIIPAVILLGLYMINPQAGAQEPPATPEQILLKKLEQAETSEEKADILNELSLKTSYNNARQSLAYASQAIEQSQKNDYQMGWITGLCNSAIAHSYQGNHLEARNAYKEAIDRALAQSEPIGQIKAYQAAGICAKEDSDFQSSLDFYNKALEVIQQNSIEDKDMLLTLYGNLAGVYALLEQWPNAAEYFQKTYNLIENDPYYEMVALFNLAYTYNNLKDYTSSEFYGRKLLELARDANQEIFVAHAQSVLGDRFYGEYESSGNRDALNNSRDHFETAVAILRKYDQNITYTNNLLNLGRSLINQNAFSEALPLLVEALDIAARSNFKLVVIKSHLLLSQAYKGLGQTGQALKHLEVHQALNEEMFKANLSQQVTRMMVRFDTLNKEFELEKAELRNQSLLKDARINRYILTIVSTLSLLFLLLVILLFVFYRNKKRMADVMRALSRTDTLTQLLNRRAMMEELCKETARFSRRGEPFTIVLTDIDHFKKFNDQWGHDCGDAVLVKIAELIRQNTRPHDHISRWGGEEFMLMFPGTPLEQGVRAAEKLRRMVEDTPLPWENHSMRITMSFGIAEYNAQAGIEDSIKKADKALYKAKECGRNRVETG